MTILFLVNRIILRKLEFKDVPEVLKEKVLKEKVRQELIDNGLGFLAVEE